MATTNSNTLMPIMMVIIPVAILFLLALFIGTIVLILKKTKSKGMRIALGCGCTSLLLFICTAIAIATLVIFGEQSSDADDLSNATNTTADISYEEISNSPELVSKPNISTQSQITPMDEIQNDPLFISAQNAVKNNDEDEFMNICAKARTKALQNPNSFHANMLFGRIMFMTKNSPNSDTLAWQYISEAYKLEPQNIEALKFFIGSSYKAKHYPLVIQYMEEPALKGVIIEPALVSALTTAYYYTREHDRGLKVLAELMKNNPTRPDIVMQHALLAANTNHKGVARQELIQVINSPYATSKMKKLAQKRLNDL